MARRSDMDAAADALYAKVPDVNCKGLCSASCGPIEMSFRERSRIRQETGITVPPAHQLLKSGNLTCPALTEDSTCGAYAVRPMLCRVWGATEALPCQWGCRPADGEQLLTAAEGYRLLGAAMDAGGGSISEKVTTGVVRQIFEKRGEDAFGTPAMNAIVRRGEIGDYIRANSTSVPTTFGNERVIKREVGTPDKNINRDRRGYA